MNPVRGRPPTVDHQNVIDAVLNHKDVVLKSDGKIVTKLHSIWTVISNELLGKITPGSLYAFVTNNRYGIRDKLSRPNDDCDDCNIQQSEIVPPLDSSAVSNEISTVSNTDGDKVQAKPVSKELEEKFALNIPREEFTKLIHTKYYKRNDKQSSKCSDRPYTVLEPGEWQQLVTDHIWDVSTLECGFNFSNHYLTLDGKSGAMNGSCNCGSTIRCDIRYTGDDAKYVKLDCTFVRSNQSTRKCGKRYLRATTREAVAKELCTTTVDVYRARKANALMLPGDPEPPHLPKSSVLSTAKHQYISSQYLDQDPIKALALMKLNHIGRNVIHNLGLGPFFVHYWSNHQNHVYKSYCTKEPACVCIDATGSIVKPVENLDNTLSKHIFLYHCVVNYLGCQFSVAQMMTESHHTNSIYFWLMEWIRLGAPYPKEVICDSSRALLTASVRAFTSYSTIEEYADACRDPTLPKCYIRIDVAHFIKMYAVFLKSVHRRIRVFYLAAIGQLILVRNMGRAREILKAILVVALSETEGTLPSGRDSQCECSKRQLKDLITNTTADYDEVNSEHQERDIDEADEDDTSHLGNRSCWWSDWGIQIRTEVQELILNEGDRENAHYLPSLCDRLIKDIKLLPLWSNVCRDDFGIGRVPASSAAVEGEFNKIKTHLLQGCASRLRVDVFFRKHMEYINGRMKIAHANATAKGNYSTEKEAHLSFTPQKEVETEVELSDTSPTEAQLTLTPEIGAQFSSTLQNREMILDGCPACNNNDMPAADVRVCTSCSKVVHILPECSAPAECDEGYGQRRICLSCKDKQFDLDVLATREVENWRGLEKPPKKRRKSRYLGNSAHEISDALTFTKNKKLPIMKNGSCMSVAAVNIRGVKTSMTHTCGFDSMLQNMLAVACDRPALKKVIEASKTKNRLLELSCDVLDKGLRTHSYRIRAEILLTIYADRCVQDKSGCQLFDCEDNIANLARALFDQMPSFEEISICDAGCTPREKRLLYRMIQRDELNDLCFIDTLVTVNAPRKCYKKDCQSLERTTVTAIGTFVLFEVFTWEVDEPIMLAKIPQKVRNLKGNDAMHDLVGIADYSGPAVKTRLSGEVGHYMAICKRLGNQWVKYDDFRNTEEVLDGSYKARPKLLIYADCSNDLNAL